MHRSRILAAALLLQAALAAPAQAQHRLTMTAAESADRVDSTVRNRMASNGSAQVLVLGRTQLLAPVGGLEAFATREAQSDRRTLRPKVIAELKRIAASEQPAIVRALGSRGYTGLWILNAVAATVDAATLRRLEQLPEVRFIYLAPGRPGAVSDNPGAIRQVLRPAAREPFVVGTRRVAWYLEKLRVPEVWATGVTGEGAIVASLDNGVNYLHSDLTRNIWINPGEVPGNGRDDDGNGYIDDLYGWDFTAGRAEVGAFEPGPGPTQHGSVTSGIVAGDGTGGIITGVAPRAQIMILKGNGLVTAPLAFQYALEHGADAMSMSFSIPDLGNGRGVWRMIADHAVAAGMVLAGGAGNFRQTATVPTQIQSPKDVPSVIAVGGVDSLLQLTTFSSTGPVEWGSVMLYGDHPLPGGYRKPDVVGFPGAGYPILAYPETYIDPNDRTRGNSLSGPQAAGIAALMFQANPALPAWRVIEILRATARDLGAPGPDAEFGAGLMDAARAVRAAGSAP